MTRRIRSAVSRVSVVVHLTPEDMAAALRADVAEGLQRSPKELPPKWFYDARGSALFEDITELAEYYPTRCERSVLVDHAADIAASTRADTLLELGSGSSEKTRLLLDALSAAGTLQRYIPVDVSESALRAAAEALEADYPALPVDGVVADFERHLSLLPGGGRRLLAFLGGTIGNLQPAQRHAFLRAVAAGMAEDDALLLGTDLVKDPGRLVAAYDDAAGVTAAFNRNVLHVINRELGGDFDPDSFDHVAIYDPQREWIEMRLRSVREQVVHVPAIGVTAAFGAGEEMRTEVSAKFRREGVERELAAVGLALRRWWTDPDGDFAVSLAVPS